jgi:cytochrome P450
MSNLRPPRELAPVGGSPPISSDPPFHHDARKLLLPAFTKTAVTRQEPATRALCHSLIDAFEGRDVVDAGEHGSVAVYARVACSAHPALRPSTAKLSSPETNGRHKWRWSRRVM